ncbi:hypothetical protein BKI52_42490 [marine bacterium AO1-C]|nr:hypothetical protein BKI52_42490 [marine bacterium AO1-C]
MKYITSLIGLLALIVSLPLNAQITDTVYVPLTPDTIYYPYRNGIQMIEVDHMKLWNAHKVIYGYQFMTRGLSLAYPVLPPISNEYFFRDKQGKVIRAFNTSVSLDSLQKFAFRNTISRRSHIENKRYTHGLLENINFEGYYKVFNMEDIQVQRKKIAPLNILMRMQMHYMSQFEKPKYQYDTTKKYLAEYPYRFKVYSRDGSKDAFTVYPRGGAEYQNYIINPTKVKFGLIDSLGKIIVPMDYQWLCPWFGVIIAQRNGKWGMINKSNKFLLPLIFDEIRWKSNALVMFRQNNKDILANYRGHIIRLKDYDQIKEYYPYLLVSKNKKLGLLDKKGQQLISCIYDKLYFVYEDKRRNLLVVQRNNLYGLVDKQGQKLVPCQYALVRYDDQRKIYLFKKEGIEYRLSKSGKMVKDD